MKQHLSVYRIKSCLKYDGHSQGKRIILLEKIDHLMDSVFNFGVS